MLRSLLKFALAYFAAAILRKYRPRIVAITGSTGKTTAKDAVFAVLSDPEHPGAVGRTQGNLNTEFGVTANIIDPNFLGSKDEDKARLSLKDIVYLKWHAFKLLLTRGMYPKILVLELAADRPGDIAYFMRFITPEVGVLTNIGDVHLEFFRDKASLIEEKGKLIAAVHPAGLAILNRDDELANLVAQRTVAEKAFVGLADGADWQARGLGISASGLHFSAVHGSDSWPIEMPAFGQQFAYSALIALAVADYFRLPLAIAAERLKNFRPPAGRFERIELKNLTLIDDTYNANPTSTLAALSSFSRLAGGRRRVAILGDMRELGSAYEKGHREVGEAAAKLTDLLLTVGEGGELIGEAAVGAGLPPGLAIQLPEGGGDAVLGYLRDNDVVLVKGSRAVHMDKIVDLLKQKFGG
ncbi:hypothetical protein A2V68_02165 [candidate division Kazan bacterium RBG_13_50_9]|uniref:UDP-N-acetylmuramoyl-tripeptide--D-alanyl-D-alanine ligase n=1 Tax=candidate division Kazan bacterium RBG_13_50_9 TaxID=1798535 RepID=A0A1F4NS88_UNCK3|nr:MAG: hypothetical protein A2V68_02165 [candidate division Kazan bacterium RBG_13_50_9]